jgi:hypothetical protein
MGVCVSGIVQRRDHSDASGSSGLETSCMSRRLGDARHRPSGAVRASDVGEIPACEAEWGHFQSNTRLATEKGTPLRTRMVTRTSQARSRHDNSIPALRRRGVVFLTCHNAIWELAERLFATEVQGRGKDGGPLPTGRGNRLR